MADNDPGPGSPGPRTSMPGHPGRDTVPGPPGPRTPARPGTTRPVPGNQPPPPPASARFPDEPPPEPRRPVPPRQVPVPPQGADLPGDGPRHEGDRPRRGGPPAPGTGHPGRPPYPAHGHPGRPAPPVGPEHPGYPGADHPGYPGPEHPGYPGPHTHPGPRPPQATRASGPAHHLGAPPAFTTAPRPTETTTRLRPIRDDDPLDRPLPGSYDPFDDPPGHRARPTGHWTGRRAAAAVACAVLGLGLIGGAVTGSWLTGDSTAAPGPADRFAAAGERWHSTPVDDLFPRTVRGEGAGPGGADRTWTRVAVAPDGTCAQGLDPLLRRALAPAGCVRLLRATYTDATRSHVTTVGMLFTKTDADGMRALRARFTKEQLDRRRDLMPRPYAAEGTVAQGFGDRQRASWTVSVLTDAPVVVLAVSGFADGRTVTDPEPATDAARSDSTTTPAQSGLGHEAKGLADRVERVFRKGASATPEKTS
ncbi:MULTISPECIES: hypothetical protein [unclassified Streptomyces]|uniref:hypothetical protein n=1 Tax=unclassified Streptomyces TaxID=2593676 RepID=UPI001F160B2E|nr:MULTISPECIES: hypothetical protein [unclassified Streptomyces]